MLNRLILKITMFELPPPKRLGTVVKNILGGHHGPPPRQIGLMIIIARSPGNRSLHQLRYHIATNFQHRRAREEPQKPDGYVLPSSPGTMEMCVFYF